MRRPATQWGLSVPCASGALRRDRELAVPRMIEWRGVQTRHTRASQTFAAHTRRAVAQHKRVPLVKWAKGST
eukprot:4948636-Prymnesium_polylepis.1